MIKNKEKRKIYIRTFTTLLAAYLLLMTGFSIHLLNQEKNVQGLEKGSSATNINNTMERILRDNIDSSNQITDLAKVKQDCLLNFFSWPNSGEDVALYSGDYNLIFNTNNNWVCSYIEDKVGDTEYYTRYGYLNPRDWFDEEEISELNQYLTMKLEPVKSGDLYQYSVALSSFWVDNEMIIPEKIIVTPFYANSFDENGRVVSSYGLNGINYDVIFVTDYINTNNLPYYKNGYIISGYGNGKKHSELRNLVLDKDKLKKAVSQGQTVSFVRVNLITYRYYITLPYQSIHIVDGQDNSDHVSYHSDFWTVVSGEFNILTPCINTLIYVWFICLLVFVVSALILSSQTYRIYKKREELDQSRVDTTNALAQDLKTPLSIISGSAQNLMENIHTEKREYYAANIQDNVIRMDKIIQEILELSAYDSEFVPVKYKEISLGDICEKLLKRHDNICLDKHITATLKGDAIIKVDFSLLEKVIDNFFVNALNFTPENGTIKINITENTLEFFNSGSYIPEYLIEEIWQPYIKADVSKSITKETGLSIASKILKAHKFTYGAKNVDNGVVFWFKW